MKVLDMFSGLGGFSQAFKDRGHEVITIDNNPVFNPTILKDINEIQYLPQVDIILASPPCECFSISSVYKHWKDGKPNPETVEALALVGHAILLIQKAKPRFWILENPRGMLRKMLGKPDYEISQCQYGRSIMKPTDLWGRLPPSFIAKKCHNGNPDHERASRSSHNGGTQNNSFSNLGSRGRAERAKIAYGLSLAICTAMEGIS